MQLAYIHLNSFYSFRLLGIPCPSLTLLTYSPSYLHPLAHVNTPWPERFEPTTPPVYEAPPLYSVVTSLVMDVVLAVPKRGIDDSYICSDMIVVTPPAGYNKKDLKMMKKEAFISYFSLFYSS